MSMRFILNLILNLNILLLGHILYNLKVIIQIITKPNLGSYSQQVMSQSLKQIKWSKDLKN